MTVYHISMFWHIEREEITFIRTEWMNDDYLFGSSCLMKKAIIDFHENEI